MSEQNSPPPMTQVLRTHVNTDTPPGLAERPALLWGLSSGVHSGLLSLQDENWDATYWSALASELLQECAAAGRSESHVTNGSAIRWTSSSARTSTRASPTASPRRFRGPSSRTP